MQIETIQNAVDLYLEIEYTPLNEDYALYYSVIGSADYDYILFEYENL